MRAEPPDHLTERVWQMVADARTGTLTTAEVIEALTLSMHRQVHYLAYCERRGCHTAYDEVAHRADVDALARAIHLVPESEVPLSTPHPPVGTDAPSVISPPSMLS